MVVVGGGGVVTNGAGGREGCCAYSCGERLSVEPRQLPVAKSTTALPALFKAGLGMCTVELYDTGS
jgi:hypothetical protein